MKLRAALFDAVGTLIELREPVGESYARLAQAHGAQLSARRLESGFAAATKQVPLPQLADCQRAQREARERDWWREVVARTLAAAGRGPREFDAYFAELYQHFASPQSWQLRSGCAEALLELRARGLATGIVSNFDQRLHEILQGLELQPLLDVVVLPTDAAARKPDPRIFHAALAHLGVAAEQAIYLGDDAALDLAGSRSAGLRALDVAHLATLAELPDLLNTLELEPDA